MFNLLRHARREFFVPKLQYPLSFKYILSITQAKQIINLLLIISNTHTNT